MTNPHFTKIEQYRDIESRNYYRILREQGKTEAETLDIIAQRSRDFVQPLAVFTVGRGDFRFGVHLFTGLVA